MSTAHSQSATFDYLLQQQLMDRDTVDQAQTLLADDNEDQSPWYIHALAGFGAWISAFVFMAFVALTGIIDNASSFIGIGLLLLISVLGINQASKKITSTYASQVMLVMSLTGHSLLAVGIGMATESTTIACLAIIAISLVFILLYKQEMHRFLSMQFLIIATLVLSADLHILNAVAPVVIITLSALAVWFWLHESHYCTHKNAHFYLTLRYALITTLIISAFFLSFGDDSDIHSLLGFTLPHHVLIATGLFLVLAYLIQQILKRLAINPGSMVSILLTLTAGLLSALFYQTPAIMMAIIVLILGIERGNRILIPIATLSMIFSLSAYYYHLDLTLLHKSLLLMSSGCVLTLLGLVTLKLNSGGH